MLRRDLFRAWIATPLGGWLMRWVPLASGGAATEGPNAADVYRRAFGWAESLSPQESERVRKAATIAIDDQHVAALIQQARPALEAIRDAAALDRCRWGTETVTSDDLARRLDALTPPEPASAAIGPESRFILSSLRTRLLAIGPMIEGAGWAGLGFDD